VGIHISENQDGYFVGGGSLAICSPSANNMSALNSVELNRACCIRSLVTSWVSLKLFIAHPL